MPITPLRPNAKKLKGLKSITQSQQQARCWEDFVLLPLVVSCVLKACQRQPMTTKALHPTRSWRAINNINDLILE